MNEWADSGLPSTAIEAMRRVFRRHPALKQVILYGSRAMGNYRAGSDIDLTFKGELDYQDLLTLERELDDLLLPYKIDLSLYCQLDNGSLLEHIDRIGKSVYSTARD